MKLFERFLQLVSEKPKRRRLAVLELLEPRIQLASPEINVELVGNNLVVTDIVGQSGIIDDELTIAADGTELTITAANPNNCIDLLGSLDGGAGDQTNSVTIPLSSFSGILDVNTLTGDDTVNIGDLTLLNGQSLDVDAGTGFDAANITGAITTTGSGFTRIATTGPIKLEAGSSVTTVDGGIAFAANEAKTTSGNFVGIEADNATIQTTGTGNIVLKGAGGDTGGSNYGVYMHSGTSVNSSHAGANAGSIAIKGYGGNGTHSNRGVYLMGSTTKVTSVSGDVSIFGRGGHGTSSSNSGVYISYIEKIESTGTGPNASKISVHGVGGDGTSSNYGTYFAGTGTASVVASVDGDISIFGNGGHGTSSSNYGVYAFSKIESTGTGADAAKINIQGVGGDGTSSNYGIYLAGSATEVTSVDGNVSLTGVGGNGSSNRNYGVYITAEKIESTGAGSSSPAIAISGLGGDGTEDNHGVYLFGTSVNTIAGNTQITGVANGEFGNGFLLGRTATVNAVDGNDTATGAISIDGAGAGGLAGIQLNDRINSDLGSVTLNSQDDIAFSGSGIGDISSDGGQVSLIANNLGGRILDAFVDAGTGDVSATADAAVRVKRFSTSGAVDLNSARGLITDDTDRLTVTGAFLAQDFENFGQGPGSGNQTLIEGWVNDIADDYDWLSDRAGTDSSGTGPSVDSTLGTVEGVYLYYETSSSSEGPPPS